jgi:hypothetical protein
MNRMQAIIPRTTLAQLVAAWRQCEQEVNQAFALLDMAGARLKRQFRDTYRFSMSVEHCIRRYSKADDLLGELKKEVWSVLVDRMELRRILT